MRGDYGRLFEIVKRFFENIFEVSTTQFKVKNVSICIDKKPHFTGYTLSAF
jgi:hypothetical protein